MGFPLKIVGLEDFIAMKIFAGGPKDLQDVVGVLEVSAEKMNRYLLEELILQYGKESAAKWAAFLKEHPLKE